MEIDSRELTKENLPSALAEAQGWVKKELSTGEYSTVYFWSTFDEWDKYRVNEYNPLTNNNQYNELTEDPEIHAGMLSVLDEWLNFIKTIEHKSLGFYDIEMDYWHNPEYKADIRLWQLRACVEFLRNRRGK